jgi:hypothetical protein
MELSLGKHMRMLPILYIKIYMAIYLILHGCNGM